MAPDTILGLTRCTFWRSWPPGEMRFPEAVRTPGAPSPRRFAMPPPLAVFFVREWKKDTQEILREL